VEERITLAAEPRSAGLARVFVSSVLAEWGRDGIAEPVVLLTSELVTNAVLHARSDIELVVDCDEDRVRVEVTDSSEDQPVLRFPAPEDTSGRGLRLVDTMSSCWGVRHHPRDGKSIWFEISA
jgi:anti-sigma regulatory factor (Ser/Thr protein kinase)